MKPKVFWLARDREGSQRNYIVAHTKGEPQIDDETGEYGHTPYCGNNNRIGKWEEHFGIRLKRGEKRKAWIVTEPSTPEPGGDDEKV